MAETPADFVFAVKGSRFITHLKKLADVRMPLANFLASGVLALDDRLGPMLWQLPPNLGFDRVGSPEFFALLPRTLGAGRRAGPRARPTDHADRELLVAAHPEHPLRHVLEVRHDSFRTPALADMLREHEIALVWADNPGKWPVLDESTTDFRYVRLHGDTELYASGYSDEALDTWAGADRGVGRGGPGRLRLLRQRREGACAVRRHGAARSGWA